MAETDVSLVAVDVHHSPDGLSGFDKDPSVEQDLAQKPRLSGIAGAGDESRGGSGKYAKSLVGRRLGRRRRRRRRRLVCLHFL
jgi:hypothetical protein